jgi:hypothetical protein
MVRAAPMRFHASIRFGDFLPSILPGLDRSHRLAVSLIFPRFLFAVASLKNKLR